MQITLEQLLESRDRRSARQAELLALCADGTHVDSGSALLCLTVMLPGPVKRSALSLEIASAAVSAVRSAFSPVFEELRDLETGYEGYFIVPDDPISAKRRAVALEEDHPLGRLFDLDVIVLKNSPFLRTTTPKQGGHPHFRPVFEDGTYVFPDGGGVIPLGREALGFEPRKCIICGRPVRECMRTRAHTTEELLKKIDDICISTNNPATPTS